MRLVTVATHTERYFPYLLESCRRHGAKIHVLGWGQAWKGFMMKYKLLKEYLKNLPDDEIVCIIDAYDVILLEPLEKIERIFKNTGARIAVAKECVPVPFYIKYIYGTCKSVSINAGTYIGYAGDLRNMVDEICTTHDCNDKKLDDQKILTAYCNKKQMFIDKNRHLFFLLCTLNRIPDVFDGKIIYKNISPCILHAPANTNIDALLKKLGYNVNSIDHRYVNYLKNVVIHHLNSIAVIAVIITLTLFIVWQVIKMLY